jgi:short-subunit dehydrogenase involved in D-alanine esterification of teichoic acids
MNLTNNTILLTGGTSGIGKALLDRFYRLENKLIVASANKNNLENLLLDYPEITVIPCDLSDLQQVDVLIADCLRDYREINILINNAGVQYNYQWVDEKYPNPLIEKEVRINLLSPLLMTQGLLPILAAHSEAAIINVSSVLALVPKQSAPVYCATKGGLHVFTQALRYQLETSTIKVFEVLPPLVDTPMTKGRGKNKMTPDQLVDEFMKNFKNDRLEMNIGKTKLLRFLKRLAPTLTYGILKNN